MLRLGVTLAAALLLLSPSANAQPGKKVAKIGIVSASGVTDHFDAFRRGLSELGWIDGQNVRIEYRYAEHQHERLPTLTRELIEAKVDVLMCSSTVTVLAAKKATSTVPIVFASVFDPVASGIVATLSRPGGNVTGATIGVGGSGTAGKWLELAKELVPGATRVAVFHNSRNPASAQSVREIQSAAKRLDTRLDMLDVATDHELAKALAAVRSGSARAIIVTNDPFFTAKRDDLVRLAADKRLPAVYFFSTFVDAGGLMSYGGSRDESLQRAATLVSKILNGAKPGDLPVEQSTRIELVISRKAASAIGLAIPPSLLVRADRIIE